MVKDKWAENQRELINTTADDAHSYVPKTSRSDITYKEER